MRTALLMLLLFSLGAAAQTPRPRVDPRAEWVARQARVRSCPSLLGLSQQQAERRLGQRPYRIESLAGTGPPGRVVRQQACDDQVVVWVSCAAPAPVAPPTPASSPFSPGSPAWPWVVLAAFNLLAGVLAAVLFRRGTFRLRGQRGVRLRRKPS